MSNHRRIIGTTDEITTCDQCGREGLSHTVVIDHLDTDGNLEGEINYYGSDCATRIFTGLTARKIENAAKIADRERREAEREAARKIAEAKRQIERAPFYAWIETTYGVRVANFGDIYDNLKAVGRKSPYTLLAEFEAS